MSEDSNPKSVTHELLRAAMQLREFGFDLTDEDIQQRAIQVAIDRATGNHVVREIPRPFHHPMVVYYVDLGDRIKIGTTRNLRGRLINLRVSFDEVLATEPGGFDVENSRHREFKDLRIGRREDFTKAPALLTHIAKLRKLHGAPSLVA